MLEDRVVLINKINNDIADFLQVRTCYTPLQDSINSQKQERRRIEERYAADLRKLAKRPFVENSAALGCANHTRLHVN